jgi:hypothetical protein
MRTEKQKEHAKKLNNLSDKIRELKKHKSKEHQTSYHRVIFKDGAVIKLLY